MQVRLPERTVRTYDPGERVRRRWAPTLLFVALAFIAGVAIPHRGAKVSPPATSVVAAPTRTVNRAPEGATKPAALPGGWPRSVAGAVGAAAASIAVDSGPSIAAADMAAQLSKDPALGWQPGAKIMLRTVPLMYRVDKYSPDRASVDVWGVGVTATDPSSVQAASVARAFYGISRLTVEWRGGDWVVTGHADLASGPRLALGNPDFPTSSSDALSTLAGFTPFTATTGAGR